MKFLSLGFLGLMLLSAQVFAQDQTSCQSAVRLTAVSHMEGVGKEYDYLRHNYPQYKILGQQLVDCEGKPTDVFVLQDSAGIKIKVFFDLSQYWGKGMGL